MRLTRLLVCPFALLLAGAAPAEPPNRVANPSFETSAKGKAAEWRIGGTLSTLSTDRANTGRASLLITDKSRKDGSNVSSSLIRVKPNRPYTIGCWGYCVEGKGLGLYVRCFTAERKGIKPPHHSYWHQGVSSRKRRWVRTAFVMTTPKDCAYISVWLHSYSTSTVKCYVDDVSVQEGALVKPKADARRAQPFKKVAVRFYEGDHPFLYVTRDDIAAMKRKAASHKWAARLLKGFLKRASSLVKRDVEIPTRGGGWAHWYACPKEGGRLITLSPTQHKCSKCGAIYSGDPYDSVIVMRRHGELARRARDLGLAFAIAGESCYAERVKEILLGYAARYNKYEMHDVRGPSNRRSAGRVGPQTLDESYWIIPVAQSYDLIASSGVLSADEKRSIENDLLRAAVKTIARNDARMSNWQSWHNAGMGAVAFCLRDRALAEKVVNGPSGFQFQMANSVSGDGLWYEGAWGYHYYALSAHLALTEMAARSGTDLYRNDRYRSMFDASMQFMAPNKQLPAFHDSGLTSGTMGPRYYEVAYRRWAGENYAWAIGLRPRGWDALLYGAADVPKVASPSLASCDFSHAGWLVLRSGASLDSMYLALDYGPHGGGHGHPDKLGFSFYALDDFVAHDPGCVAYGVPIHAQWYKQTVAHNTIVLDEVSQDECTGQLTLFCSSPSFRAGAATADEAYAPAQLSRLAAMTDEYLVLVDEVSDRHEHTMDWVFHGEGDLACNLALKAQSAALGKAEGYQHVTDVRRGPSDGQWALTWRTKKAAVRLTILAEPGTEVITGKGWGLRGRGKVPMVVARRKGKATRYAALIEAYRGQAGVERVERVAVSNGVGLHVQGKHGHDWLLYGQAGESKTHATIASDARLAAVRVGAKSYAYLVDGARLRCEAWRLTCATPARVYVGRAAPGQHRIQNQGKEGVRIELAGRLLAEDGAKGEPILYKLDGGLSRVSKPVLKRVGDGWAFEAEAGASYELSFPGAPVLRETEERARRADLEAARLASLPPIPEFPVKAFEPPAGRATGRPKALKLQAEAFTAEGGGRVVKSDGKVGAEGQAFLMWNQPGHWLEWTFHVPTAGTRRITFRYCTANDGASRAILLDGAYPAEVCKCYAFPNTGGYSNDVDDWRSLTLTDPKTGKLLAVHLAAGEHKLRVYNYSEPVNLDYILLD